MYRCKDCGKEYIEKVDYCDCGNNTFDYVEDFVPAKPTRQPKQPKQPLSVEQKSEIISRIFFTVCLILSLIVWLMPVKVEQTVKEEIKEQKVDLKSIPNLEKIWNNTPPKVETAQQKEEKPQTPLDAIREAIPDKILPKPIQTQNPNNANKQVNKQSTKAKPVVQNKPITTQPKASSQNKPVTQNKPATQNKPITQNKPVQQTQNKPSSAPQTQNKQTPNPNNLKPQQQQTKQPTEQQKTVYNPNSPEMLKYKSSLRSALFAKLPIGSVFGSGSCSVQFAVDKTGKLINRAFTQQSGNKTLDDAVYYMLMSVPRFAAPPEGYNQELIKMNVDLKTDGRFEISIH